MNPSVSNTSRAFSPSGGLAPVGELSQVASLTRRLVWIALAGSFEAVARHFKAGASLVFPGEHGEPISPKSRAEAIATLTAYRRKLPPNLLVLSESYKTASLGPGIFSVVARCLIGWFHHGEQPNLEGPSAAVVCSFVWANESGVPLINLCHCSSQPPELLPQPSRSVISTPTPIMTERMAADTSRLQVRDAEGTTHWLLPESVIFVKAAHQYTDIYCDDRRLRVHATFKSVVEQLGDAVVPVHRSYAVNPHHVVRLEGTSLYLATGSYVPVPQNSIGKVRTMLQERGAAGI